MQRSRVFSSSSSSKSRPTSGAWSPPPRLAPSLGQIGRHAQTGCASPRSSTGPSSSISKRPRVSRCAAGPTSTAPASAACWRRAATLTASPVAKVESESSATTSPASIPARATRPRSSTESMIASAARIARSASSSCATGTPNAAITASPAYFSTVPPWSRMLREARSKNWFTLRRATSGSAPVTSAVESTMSTKRTVASLRSTVQF